MPWLKVSSPVRSGVHSTDVSPAVSTAARYGWTIAVRPAACRRATCRAASSACPGSAYRPVSWLAALTVGLTTHSPARGAIHASPGATYLVGVTGTPAAARSARYRLSVFHSTTSAGLASRGTRCAQATNSSRRGG